MNADEDIPPAAVCARCGRADCEGTCVTPEPPPLPVIPWEQRRSPRAVWDTCLYLALSPELWLSQLQSASTLRALQFAVLVETCAVGSFVVPLGIVVALVLYSWGLSPSLLGSFGAWFAACVGLGGLMVALHVLWGLLVEVFLTLFGAAPRWRSSFLLACYSCAWDLPTSPAGVVVAWVAGRRQEVARLLRQAVRNPRAASLHYLTHERGQPMSRALMVAGGAALVTVLFALCVGGAALMCLMPDGWPLWGL